MAISEEIGKAITAHGQWKQKLRSAIDTGTSESTPERVRKDNNCSFGKWLHDRIDENDKSSPHYLEAVKLHAKFHVEAASVLKLALAGRTADKRNENLATFPALICFKSFAGSSRTVFWYMYACLNFCIA